jgi:NAD(P)-dependent dehydrogenase (short-subunit alcohol dehydrogenase family)
VILGSRDISKGSVAAKSFSGDIVVKELDVTDDKTIFTLKADILAEFGSLDVLINNAGIGVGVNGAVDADPAEVKRIMETNFFGAWRMIQIMMPLLRKSSEGRIINMSSGMGELGSLHGDYAGYRLSKSSMNALTILLSDELKSSGIKVNAMCPGWVRTDMGGSSAPRNVSQGADTAVWLSTEKTIPTGKFFRDRKIIDW